MKNLFVFCMSLFFAVVEPQRKKVHSFFAALGEEPEMILNQGVFGRTVTEEPDGRKLRPFRADDVAGYDPQQLVIVYVRNTETGAEAWITCSVVGSKKLNHNWADAPEWLRTSQRTVGRGRVPRAERYSPDRMRFSFRLSSKIELLAVCAVNLVPANAVEA